MKKDIFFIRETRRKSSKLKMLMLQSSPIPILSHEDMNYLLAKKISENIGVAICLRGFSKGEDEPTEYKYVFSIDCPSETDEEITICREKIQEATKSFETALNNIVDIVI